MINVKIVLFGFYFPASLVMMYQWALAQGLFSEVELTTLEMMMWASLISFIGGVSAAYRTSSFFSDLFRSGMNTMVMGACLAAISTYWTLDKPAFAWLVIGCSGILSLGGLATIDWLTKLIKQKIQKKVENE